MAIIQTLLTALSRQTSKILNTIFGWATVMLFGKVPPKRQIYLSAMSFGSVLWIVAVLGIIFPRLGVFLVSFIPLSKGHETIIRLAMLAAAVLLPLAIGGLSLAILDEPDRPRGSAEKTKAVLKGYPYVLGLAITFLLLLIFAPIMKIRDLVKRWTSAHVQMVVHPEDYSQIVTDIRRILALGEISTMPSRASWMLRLPIKIMSVFGGGAFKSLIADHLTVLKSAQLEVTLLPFDLVFRGKKQDVFNAQALLTEHLIFTKAYLTWDKAANEIEDKYLAIWNEIKSSNDGHLDEALARLRSIMTTAKNPDFPQDEWEILFREGLFLEREILRRKTEAGDAKPAPDAPSPSLWSYLNFAFDLKPLAVETAKTRALDALKASAFALLTKTFKKQKQKTILAALSALGAARLFSTSIIKMIINYVLGKGRGYVGRIQGVRLDLTGGIFGLRGVLFKTTSEKMVARMFVREIVLKWNWVDLLRGAVIFELLVDTPTAYVTMTKHEGEKAEKPKPTPPTTAKPWQTTVRNLFPFNLKLVELINGYFQLDMVNGNSSSVFTEDARFRVRNLTNREFITGSDVAYFDRSTNIMGQTPLTWSGEVSPFADAISGRVAASMDDLDLPQFNGLFRQLAGVDIESGSVNAALEAEADHGELSGFVKPVVSHLDVLNTRREKPTFMKRIKEGSADFLAWVLRKRDSDRITLKIDISGTLDDIQINKWQAARSLFWNMFHRGTRVPAEDGLTVHHAEKELETAGRM